MDENAACGCVRAQYVRALNVSVFYGWVDVPIVLSCVRWQLLCPVFGGQSADAGTVCVWVGGCVRIDPLRDRTAFYRTADLHFKRRLRRYMCCDWVNSSKPPPYHLYAHAVWELSNCINCLNVWANVGQLIWVGFWWRLRVCSCIKRHLHKSIYDTENIDMDCVENYL